MDRPAWVAATLSHLRYLRDVASARSWAGLERLDAVHQSVVGPVLASGWVFEPMALPASVERGTPTACFANSIELSVEFGGAFVEGYASSLVPQILHAWVALPDGCVLDPTWRESVGLAERGYVGIPFDPGVVLRAAGERNGDLSMVEDYRRGWPLQRDGVGEWMVHEAFRERVGLVGAWPVEVFLAEHEPDLLTLS